MRKRKRRGRLREQCRGRERVKERINLSLMGKMEGISSS